MHQDVAKRHVDNLQPSEVVATFPEGKKVVKRLIRDHEDFLKRVNEAEEIIREEYAGKVSMYDLDITVKLAMTSLYGTLVEETQEHLTRLKNLLYIYDPPPQTGGSITQADVERAKKHPIGNFIKVKRGVALCPFHTEKRPSFHVYKDNHAHCFGCGKHADVIDIYMHLRGVGFVEAVRALL